MNRRHLFQLLVVTGILLIALALSPHVVQQVCAQGIECPSGFVWQRMSGVGCVQENCFSVPNAHLSYTSQCICADGYSGCYEPVDYAGFDKKKCGPNCPNSRLVACVKKGETCPGAKPAPVAPPPVPGKTTVPQPVASPPAAQPPVVSTPGQLPVAPAPTRPSPTSSVPDLVRDLEKFLAGEGIKGPSPEQAAAAGVAVSTLIGAWVLVNLLAGARLEDLLRAVREWSSGPKAAAPQVEPEPVVETETVSVSEKVTDTVEKAPPRVPDAEQVAERQKAAVPSDRKPAAEGTQDWLTRRAEDAKDVLDAADKTREQFQDKFMEKIPEQLKATQAWEEQVQPLVDKIEATAPEKILGEILANRELWEETREKLKGRVPEDCIQAVNVLQSTIRTTVNIPMETVDKAHDALVQIIKTVLTAGQAKPDIAERAIKAIEEHKEALHQVAEDLARLPTKAIVPATKGVFGEYWKSAESNNPEIAGVKGEGAFEPAKGFDPNVGLRKAERWYRGIREWLGKQFWQLREYPPIEND